MAVIFDYILADIAVAVVTCLVITYFYFAQGFKYWKKRGVHYEKPTSFLGNIGDVIFQRENIGCYLKKVYDRNPGQPVVGFFAVKKPVLMARDLGVIRNILVKDAHAFLDRSVAPSEDVDPLSSKTLFALKGKKWRHMRIKLTPTFTSGKIKNMFYLMNECGKQLLPCIDQEMSKGNSVVVKDTVARYSTDVIASCAFGLNANALSDPQSEFRAITRKIFERTPIQNFSTLLALFMPGLLKIFMVKAFDERISTYIRKTFWDVADHRKKNKIVRKDFVDILMRLKNEGEVRAEDERESEEIKQDSKYMAMERSAADKVDVKLDSDDYVAQAFIFIAAGYETSSSVISFTLYELALNPDIQDKLRREIVAVLDKHNSEVTYEAIAAMSYLEMVMSETLRKYPTVPVLERKCLQDYKIPGTEVTVEKGTSVMIPVLGIHWDASIYPQPDKFDPERFSTENKSKRPNFAHLPFGEGPRICIGMRFGQMQVKTALVHILTTYNVRPCAETPSPPLRMKPTGLSAPSKDIVLAFEKLK